MIVKHGNYLTVEQYRQLKGYATRRSIYRKLADGLIEGAVKIGDRWLIPSDALIIDRRFTVGKYVAWRRRYGRNKQAQD